MKILVLCTGNSCRSQMAHGFLQSFDQNLVVKSAGTEASGKLNPKAVEVMNEIGIDIAHHTSDPVNMYLNEDWDFVITVCGDANENCPIFPGTVNHHLHMGYEDPSDAIGSKEYIWGEFRRIRDLIQNDFLEFYNEELVN